MAGRKKDLRSEDGHAKRAPRSASGGAKTARRVSPLFAAALILFIVAAALIAGLLKLSLDARACETVYPGVRILNTEVGGLTRAEAERALADSGADPYLGRSVAVRFADCAFADFSVSAEELSLTLDLGAAAEAAYGFGRDGNLIQNGLMYIKCRFLGGADAPLDRSVSMNVEPIKAKTLAACAAANLSPTAPRVDAGERSLKLTAGLSGRSCDAQEIAETVYDRFMTLNFSDVEYTPQRLAPPAISLDAAYAAVCREPEDSVYSAELSDFTEERDGVSFDLEAAKKKAAALGEGESAVIKYIFTAPSLRKADNEGLLFRDLLARSETPMAYNPDRTVNVELGAACIDGVVVQPGAVFSFNSYVGPYTKAAGYLYAAAYSNGEIVQELGGGVCQIATGVYYCTLLANLEVVSRACHLYVPSYIEYGLDATVSYGVLDYEFRNDTDYPVKLLARVEGEQLIIELLGTDTSGNYVEMECITAAEDPYQVIYEEDPGMEPGAYYYKTSGYSGCTVVTYRRVYSADGALLLREYEDESVYARRDVIIVRGPAA